MRTDKAQTHTTIRTATSLPRKIPTMNLTTTTEEEEWLEYLKRSTDEAIENDGEREDAVLDQNP